MGLMLFNVPMYSSTSVTFDASLVSLVFYLNLFSWEYCLHSGSSSLMI